MKKWLPLFLLLLIVSCNTIPFKKTEFVPLEDVDPQEVIQDFDDKLPSNFQIMSSIIFKFKGREMSALGLTEVDLDGDSFKVVCLSPVGMKLFEITRTNGVIENRFTMEEIAQYGDISKPVGEDIYKIYFNRTPFEDAFVTKGKNKILYSQPFEQGNLEYIFGGKDLFLATKRYKEKNKVVWTISYYEYEEKEGKIFPKGIILNHLKHGYRLEIRLKEINT